MRVFVTGATGFIGQAVVKELHEHGHQVLGLARSDASAETLQKLGADVHRGSLEDLDSLKKGAQAADGVIHLGFGTDWGDRDGMCRTDREALSAMASVMEGTNKPLVIPSGTVMLPGGHLVTEDDSYDTTNDFSAARGLSETLVQSFAPKGIRSIIVRLAPTVHGDGDKAFITMIIQSVKEKGSVGYLTDGSNVWPAVHRIDAARLFRLAIEKGTAGSTYHGVAEQGVPWKDIADALGTALKLPTKSLTREEVFAHYGWMAILVTMDNPSSSAKTREQLGWKPEHVGLVADVRDGAWYRAQ